MKLGNFSKKKIKLSVFERILLIEIINSVQIDFTITGIIKELESQLVFSDKELQNLDITIDDGQASWKKECDFEKAIYFDKTIHKVIVSTLKELKNNDFLEREHFSLYNKIVK